MFPLSLCLPSSLYMHMSSADRLINWTAKPFIKFNKALFGGSGELVLVRRATAAIPANHIIIMRLY